MASCRKVSPSCFQFVLSGGTCNRKFYIGEIERIESKYKADLPKGGYTQEQINAGYEGLSRKYGFFRTLAFMEKATNKSRLELLNWTVAEFKYNFGYIAWENEIDRKFQEDKKPPAK